MFAPQDFGFSVLVSVVVCGFSFFFKHLGFGFRPKYKRFLDLHGIGCGFSVFPTVKPLYYGHQGDRKCPYYRGVSLREVGSGTK